MLKKQRVISLPVIAHAAMIYVNEEGEAEAMDTNGIGKNFAAKNVRGARAAMKPVVLVFPVQFLGLQKGLIPSCRYLFGRVQSVICAS